MRGAPDFPVHFFSNSYKSIITSKWSKEKFREEIQASDQAPFLSAQRCFCFLDLIGVFAPLSYSIFNTYNPFLLGLFLKVLIIFQGKVWKYFIPVWFWGSCSALYSSAFPLEDGEMTSIPFLTGILRITNPQKFQQTPFMLKSKSKWESGEYSPPRMPSTFCSLYKVLPTLKK